MKNCWRVLLFAGLAVWLVAGCENRGGEAARQGSVAAVSDKGLAVVPLPDVFSLSQGQPALLRPVSLRVAFADNPRFAVMPEDERQAVLARAEAMVWRFFSLRVKLQPAGRVSLSELFAGIPPKVRDERAADILPMASIDAGVREQIQQSIFATLTNAVRAEDTRGIRQLLDYARPYLLPAGPGEKPPDDLLSLSYALADTLITRNRQWQQLAAPDGKPLLDDGPWHQWVWWDSLGYGALPFDVIISNQPVVSIESYGMDVHSALRGGFTAGTTSYNKLRKPGSPQSGLSKAGESASAFVYISLYPFLHDNALLSDLRADKSYSRQQRIDYAAALLTHELGHLLLHLGHPFGETACVMSPTPQLRYRQWYEGLDAADCAVGSSAAMRPGSAVIEYHVDW